MPRVAIVIVTYNSAAQIGGCLEALHGVDADVIVVDNGSADATREIVLERGVKLIPNPRNAGFAAAVNQGIEATSAPLILLLNADAQLVRGLDEMADFAEKSGVGAVGGMLLDEKGQPQRGFMARNLPTPAALIFEVLGLNRAWQNNPVNWNYRCLGLDHMTISEASQPAGAFLMFSRSTWQMAGRFEESFWPIWFEDVDFCARVHALGLKNYYHPGGVAKHSGAHSIRNLALEIRESYWYGSLLEYAARHFGWLAFSTTCVAVVIGAVFRAAKGFPHFRYRAIEVYGGIAGLALRRALAGRRVIPDSSRLI